MRKLIVQQFGVSLDGFSATEDGEGWTRWAQLADPELDAHIVECVRRAGTHIMGLHTYFGHAEYWPKALDSPDPAERAIAELLNNGSKIVFSRSLAEASWPGTAVAAGDTSEEIARLKAEPGAEILAVGGVSFLRSLVRQQLFDSIRLFVLPYVAGHGVSISRRSTVPRACAWPRVMRSAAGCWNSSMTGSPDPKANSTPAGRRNRTTASSGARFSACEHEPLSAVDEFTDRIELPGVA